MHSFAIVWSESVKTYETLHDARRRREVLRITRRLGRTIDSRGQRQPEIYSSAAFFMILERTSLM